MFSGSTPGKVLLVLKHLNMASIKERTFLITKKSIWHLQYYLYGMRARHHFCLSVCLMDPLQLVVMVGQIAQGILPSLAHMESLI